MAMQAEIVGEPVHALPRVSLDGTVARQNPDSPAWQSARSVYLARFPEAEPMTELGDFSFVLIHVTSARQVAGFGATRPLAADEIASILRPL
jgi:putative heme iron utilization protein